MPAVREPIRVPEFVPGEWVNTTPLTMAALRGRVVVVHFWDYTCLTCLHVLPYLQQWSARYQALGLTVVGIHTPEFTFAHDPAQVRAAAARLGLGFPILLDNAHANWHAWANRYWPATYVVDAGGNLRFFHFGEGEYLGLELAVQDLLRAVRPTATLPPLLHPLRPADDPDAVCYRCTPERHLGFRRGQLGHTETVPAGQPHAFAEPALRKPELPYLSGYWRVDDEAATLVGEVGALLINYRAREVLGVLSPPPDGPGIVEIEQDGAPIDYANRGADVHPEAGAMVLTVDAPRLYTLVENPHFARHDLRLRLHTPGTAVYSLAFDTECVAGIRPGEEAA
jgi:thiol-disulfide isomerase/thioredoxin